MVRQKKRMSQQDIDMYAFGKEPTDVPVEFFNSEQRKMFLVKSLTWYSRAFERKRSEKFVESWIQRKPYIFLSKNQKKVFSKNFASFIPTFFGLMKLEDDGFILNDSEIKSIKEHVLGLANKSSSSEQIEEIKNEDGLPSKKSPRDYEKEKINSSILSDLEGMVDIWLHGKTLKERKTEYPFEEKLRSYNINSSFAVNVILSWCEERIAEYNYAKTAEEYILKPANINRVIQNLKSYVQILKLYKVETNNRKQRKPRKKKETPISKIVESVKYQKESKEYKISSVSPEKILGKKTVYLFDTKYRILRVLFSDTSKDGFGVKGTTIQNIDEENSYGIRLRKPEEFLPNVLTKTKLQIEKLVERLSTKPAKTTGRINQNVVILRVV